MMPVPPPLIFEFGTAVRATPLKVTLVTLASAVVASSTATPTRIARSVPPPRVWDQESDVLPVVVVAARLAASKEMAAWAGGATASSRKPERMASVRTRADAEERRNFISIGLPFRSVRERRNSRRPCGPGPRLQLVRPKLQQPIFWFHLLSREENEGPEAGSLAARAAPIRLGGHREGVPERARGRRRPQKVVDYRY